MKRQWARWGVAILLTPLLLFVILMVLLYIPPVQNFLRREAANYASQTTGMEITVQRIDLRFPLNLLVSGLQVTQQPDTLLTLQSLNLRIQALPLFSGKIAVDDITVQQATINSAQLLPGIHLCGVLGQFSLQSKGIDLVHQTALIDHAELSDTHLQLILNDTTDTPKSNDSIPLRWKFSLQALRLANVSFSMQLPADSMQLSTHIGEVQINEILADLGNQSYALKHLLLSASSVAFDQGFASHNVASLSSQDTTARFTPSQIALHDIRVELDSVLYHGRNLHAALRHLSLYEKSGLSITSLSAHLTADSTLISLPQLKLITPHSDIELSAQTYWQLVDIPTTGQLTAHLRAHIGKQDLMLLGGNLLPKTFQDAYPFRPLVIEAGTQGNLKQMQLSRFKIDLPGAFTLSGDGELWNLTDSITRSATVDLRMITRNLDFLTGLAGIVPGGSIAIPNNIDINTHLTMLGPQFNASLQLQEEKGKNQTIHQHSSDEPTDKQSNREHSIDRTRGIGSLRLEASFHSTTEAYQVNLQVNALQLHRFLPKDSLYEVSASAQVRGRGIEITSPRSSATLAASVDALHYAQHHLSGIQLSGDLRSAIASAKLTSDNALLRMTADGEYNLSHHYPDGKLTVDVTHIDLQRILSTPPQQSTSKSDTSKPQTASAKQATSLAFRFVGEVRQERVFAHLAAGDLKFDLSARNGLYPLIAQSTHFAQLLTTQIKQDKMLDHAALRHALPGTILTFTAGHNNPLAWFLNTRHITYRDLTVRFATDPEWGINGKAAIHNLKIDTLQLDTLRFTVRQDTAQMKLRAAVINAPTNPQRSFKAELNGEIRTDDATLTLNYLNAKGETGLLLGLNARPLTQGEGKGDGVALTFGPEEPTIAFRTFRFAPNSNWIYLHHNLRVYANIDLHGPDNMGFRMNSLRTDSTSLQNMDVELKRIRLDDLTAMLPYFPALSGLFSAEAHYVQKSNSLELSAEATIERLTYENRPIGNLTLGATWLPGQGGKQYVNTYLSHNGQEILLADGALYPTASGQDSIEVNATLEHFPLKIANAFVPDQLVTLGGDVDGKLHITGSTDRPLLNGQLVLDSVSIYAPQAGARFTFDNRPVPVVNNRVLFDKYALFTTSTNPFTIDGYVDFDNLNRPHANLALRAKDYTLLNARRTKESLVYGKVQVDFNSTLQGVLTELVMRGNMSLLPSTDVTYVMTDSPLTVQDRLGELVTFTSFASLPDSLIDSAHADTNKQQHAPTVSLGGMDVRMNVQIDPSVRLKVDLNADRSQRVELQGGGNLSLQYTPQGDLTLGGRYTLTGGLLKYSLPVIPLKDFLINNGSYVEWTGNPMDPSLNFTATERVRASVSTGDNGASRMVSFDISVVVKNRLDDLSLSFELAAPEDATVQNQLLSMGPDERSKQAIAMLVTGIYLANSGSGTGGGLNMGAALNSVLTGQINALAGNLRNANLSVGVEDHQDGEAGGKRTDYSFSYSQRFFNDRFQIVLGGKVSTGANATNDAESFIDNISFEYRLDTSNSRYVRLFHNKNYESVLEGEITETGVGLVLRKKMDRLEELFIFKRKK